MNRFVRFFSRRWTKKDKQPEHSGVAEMNSPLLGTEKSKQSDIECIVHFLNGTSTSFYIAKKGKCEQLLDLSLAYIGLKDEREYFSLQSNDKLKAWIDPTKVIKKQCPDGPPYVFDMHIKFFPAHPHLLRDDYARYLFVLQLREDLLNAKIQCPDDQVAAELASLLLQGEFGNYDASKHTAQFISTFRFLPEERHSEMFELAILQEYKKIRSRDLKPSETDRMFLEKVCLLPNYGVDIHTVQGKDKKLYYLGLTPTGILVIEGNNKIGLFVWAKIIKLEMKGKKLKLVVSDEDEQSRKVVDYTFVFILPDTRSCKHLWKCAIEQHTFFRLTDAIKPPTKLQQFFRLKSRFYTSFRTEYQLQQQSSFGSSSFRRRDTSTGQSLRSDTASKAVGVAHNRQTFVRVPSRRVSARPNWTAHSNSPAFCGYDPTATPQKTAVSVHTPNSLTRPSYPGTPRNPYPSVVATRPKQTYGNRPVVEDHRQNSPISLPRDYIEYTV